MEISPEDAVATQGRDPKLTAAQVMRDGAVTRNRPGVEPGGCPVQVEFCSHTSHQAHLT